MNPQSLPPRKAGLCKLLRGTADCFIEQTSGKSPAQIRESAGLRTEIESLITIYECGLIDPVEILRATPLAPSAGSPSESVPLTGAA